MRPFFIEISRFLCYYFAIDTQGGAIFMEFKPVLRFGVMSDLHYCSERPLRRERFKNAMETLYSYAEGQEYTGVDALYVVGDFADTGRPEQMQWLKEDMDACLRPDTLLVMTLANHELHYVESEQQALADFDRIFNMKTDRHEVIKGYHFISVTTTRDDGEWHDSFDDAKRKFLKTELKKAAEDTPNKPIFVFQHPGIKKTTPGAAYGNLGAYDILAEYKNVIDFSGHSHIAANDPREIHQRDFTSVTTGSLAYISLGNKWLYTGLGSRGYTNNHYSQMVMVEVDENGLVLIKYIDAARKAVLREERFVDVKNFTYVDGRTDASPVFEEGDVHLEATEEGLKLTFPKATCESGVWYYALKFFGSDGKVVYEENIPSDHPSAEPKAEYVLTFEDLPENITSCEIKAVGFFGNVSSSVVDKKLY